MPSARVQCTHSRGSTNDSPLLPTIRSSSSPSSPQRRWSFMTLGPSPVPHQPQPGSAPSMRAGAAERPEPSLLSQLGLGRKDSQPLRGGNRRPAKVGLDAGVCPGLQDPTHSRSLWTGLSRPREPRVWEHALTKACPPREACPKPERCSLSALLMVTHPRLTSYPPGHQQECPVLTAPWVPPI